MDLTIEMACATSLEEAAFAATGNCCDGAAAATVAGESAAPHAEEVFCVAWEWPDGRVERGKPLRHDMAEYCASSGNDLKNGVRYWVERFRG